MVLEDVLQRIGNFEILLLVVPLSAFIFTYARYSPWRADPIGIERMAQKISLLSIMLVVIAGNFLPEEFDLFRYASRIVVFGGILVLLTLQVINLRRVQTNSTRPLFFTWWTYRAQEARRAKRQR